MKKLSIEPLIWETYLAVVRNSVGSRAFQIFFANIEGKKKNVLQNGELSCAFFVSSVLTMFKYIKRIHTTVKSTVVDLEKSGWRKVKKPKIGSILVWEVSPKSKGHKHIGFYIGNSRAVSNSAERKVPIIHHWTFGSKNGKPHRRVEAMYERKT